MDQPKVIDFDDGEISVRLDGKELRGWIYKDEAERRQKMLQAREYVEGWCDGRIPNAAATPSDPLVGLDERLDRLLLTASDNNRFVLSTESAQNIVGIVREWLRVKSQVPAPCFDSTTDWLPIETAPKDEGRHILLHGNGSNFTDCSFVGYWTTYKEKEPGWQMMSSKIHVEPTLWMPLPTVVSRPEGK